MQESLTFSSIISGIIFSSVLVSKVAIAQIIPDTTLSNENSQVTPNVNIKGDLADLIESGAIRDTNLFHSFLEFNIGEGQRVFFANPDGVVNIFSRITGNNPSEILGTLGVNGSANLFLINPNGIVFGEDASLDVNGSFLASTAESVIFADGTQFSTTDTQTEPLLTVSIPIGLQLGASPGNIINRSFALDSTGEFEVGLQVQPGNTLALVGGEVSLEGGILTAESGRIEIGSVGGNNIVALNATEQGLTLSYENIEAFQDVNLLDLAFIDTSGDAGGAIQIQGQNVVIAGDAQINSSTYGEAFGETIIVKASESITLDGDFTGIFTDSFSTGKAGDLQIETTNLLVQNGANIGSFAGIEDFGQAGNLTVQVSESIELVGTSLDGFPSALVSQAETGAGGDISIDTQRLIVKDGAIIDNSTFGIGNSGNIDIQATESVEIIGTNPEGTFPSGIFAQVAIFAPDDAGNAGNLNIDTGKLIIRDGAQIANTARFGGNGGELTINASEFILLEGTAPDATPLRGSSGIFVSADPVEDESGGLISPIGNAGELNITTDRLTVQDGAKISADNFGTGEGGDATLNVNNLIVKDGGLVRAGSFGEGAGGILRVNATESVEISGSGTIGDTQVNSSLFTQAEGTGDAGDLSIDTSSLIVKDGGEITASTLDSGIGGDVEIKSQQLTLSDGGTITAETAGAGAAGNIILEISDDITLTGNGSGLFASTGKDSTGKGGSISTQNQTPQTITIKDGAEIAVNSNGTGEGGSITLATENLTINKGAITAETDSSQGGNITLTVGDTLRFENRVEITATAGIAQGAGDGGNVTIDADTILAFPTDNPYKITAQAFTGDGGRIDITTNNFFGYFNNDNDFVTIDASSSGGGVDGDVAIDILEVDPARGLTELPSNIVDASRLIDKSCLAGGAEESANEFVVTGRGGLPENPNESFKGDAVLSADWVTLPQGETEVNRISKVVNDSVAKEIVEAKGWIVGANGNVILTTEATATASLSIPWLAPHDCD